MRKSGTIIDYDGNFGIILSKENIKYEFMQKDLIESKNIKVYDNVTFLAEKITQTYKEKLVARFIKQI